MNRALVLATNLFPIRVLIGGAPAQVRPAWFTRFSGEFITWGLAVIMLGMGITLRVDDFKRVLKMPRRLPCLAPFRPRFILSSAASSPASGGCDRCGSNLLKRRLFIRLAG